MPLYEGLVNVRPPDSESQGDEFKVAMFRGETDGHAVVLMGSLHHMIGENGTQPQSGSRIIIVTHYFIDQHVPNLQEAADMLREQDGHTGSVSSGQSATNELILRTALRIAPGPAADDYGRVGSKEFLAVPLLEGHLPGEHGAAGIHVVLGTPIYVSEAIPDDCNEKVVVLGRDDKWHDLIT